MTSLGAFCRLKYIISQRKEGKDLEKSTAGCPTKFVPRLCGCGGAADSTTSVVFTQLHGSRFNLSKFS